MMINQPQLCRQSLLRERQISKQLLLTFGHDNRICVWQLSMNGDNILPLTLITAILDLEDDNHIAIGLSLSEEMQIINYLNNKEYP